VQSGRLLVDPAGVNRVGHGDVACEPAKHRTTQPHQKRISHEQGADIPPARHQERNAQQQSERKHDNVSTSHRRQCEHVVQTHHEVGNDDGPHR